MDLRSENLWSSRNSSPFQFRRNGNKSREGSSVAQLLNQSSEELPADSEHIYLSKDSLDQTFVEDSNTQRELNSLRTKKNKITSKPKDFKILALQTSYKKTPDSPRVGIPDVQEDDGELDLHLDLSQLRTDTPKQFSKPPIPSYRTIPDDTTHSLWASEPLVREERREEPVQFDYNKIIQDTKQYYETEMRHMREKYEKESLKQADLINRLENDIQQLKSQRDNKNLTAEMKRMLREDEMLKIELSKSRDTITTLQREVGDLRAKNFDANTTIQEQTKRKEKDQDTLKQMLIESEQMRKEAEYERQLRIKYEKQLQSLEQGLSTSKFQVETFQKNSKTMMLEAETKEKELSQQKNLVAKMQKENDQLREKSQNLAQEVTDLTKKVKSLELRLKSVPEPTRKEEPASPEPPKRAPTSPVAKSKVASTLVWEETPQREEPDRHLRYKRDVGTLNFFEPPPEKVAEVSSPVSKVPWATDMSFKEHLEATAKIEKDLMSLSFQKSQLESEYQKLSQNRIKTQQALKRKMELEQQISEVNRKISKAKSQLKEIGL